jgi:type II secretory pathway pseudopilin PulG
VCAVKNTLRNLGIAFIVLFLIFSAAFMIGIKQYRALEVKNTKLQNQLQSIQQQKAGYTEGKYTLITNLSSSIYLNRIPNNFDKIYPWEDVNGVKGFDTISGGLYLRYVEGHIQWPQLALYAPEMRLEVVSDTKWPKGE